MGAPRAAPAPNRPGSLRPAVAGLAVVLVLMGAALVANAVWSPPRSGSDHQAATGSLDARPVVGPVGGLPTNPAELWAAIGGEPAPSTASPTAKSGTTPAVAAPDPAPVTDLSPAMGSAAAPERAPAAPPPITPPAPVIEAPVIEAEAEAEVEAPVIEAPAPAIAHGPNLLDADSATFEGSTGSWKQWFSDTLTGSANDAHTGERSMRVRINALHGWGVELKIWPGFVASPGRYVVGFAAKAESPDVTAATMTVHWHHDTVEIGSTTVTLALTDSWQETSALATAPAGTTFVRIDFRNRAGGPGDRLLLDDILVAPVAT